MHKDWVLKAATNAPEQIDGHMTINEFVDKYTDLDKLVDFTMVIAEAMKKNKK
jgi:hypothetical protein